MSKDGWDTASLISMQNSHFYRTALYCDLSLKREFSLFKLYLCWSFLGQVIERGQRKAGLPCWKSLTDHVCRRSMIPGILDIVPDPIIRWLVAAQSRHFSVFLQSENTQKTCTMSPEFFFSNSLSFLFKNHWVFLNRYLLL